MLVPAHAAGRSRRPRSSPRRSATSRSSRSPASASTSPGPTCDGMTFDAFIERYGQPDWAGDPYLVGFPGGETLAAFKHRAAGALHRLAHRHEGETIVVACHAGVVDVGLRSFLNLPMSGVLRAAHQQHVDHRAGPSTRRAGGCCATTTPPTSRACRRDAARLTCPGRTSSSSAPAPPAPSWRLACPRIPRRQVLLLEAGPGGRPGGGLDPFAAVEEPGRVWPGPHRPPARDGAPEPYLQGRGARGLVGRERHGGGVGHARRLRPLGRCRAGAAVDLAGAIARVEAALPARTVTRRAPSTGPSPRRRRRRADGHAAGLATSTPPLLRGRRLPRRPPGTVANLVVRPAPPSTRVLLTGRTAGGVRLASGEELEAAPTWSCAPAPSTRRCCCCAPAIDRPGLGENLQDHPALRIVLPPGARPAGARPPAAALRRDRARRRRPAAADGPHGRRRHRRRAGRPDGFARTGLRQLAGDGPVVAFDLLDDERDRDDAGGRARPGAAGSPRPAASAPRSQRSTELGDVFHAAGTCRMGDGDGVVDAAAPGASATTGCGWPTPR